MSKKTPESSIVENQAAAAALLGVDVSEVKSAKAEGCPAFKAAGRIHIAPLRQWLTKRRAEKPRVKAPRAPSDLPKGLQAAKHRLATEEAEAAQRYREAIAGNESAELVARRLREWMSAFSELRKTSNMAEADDLVSRASVESSLSVFAGYLRSELETELRARCPRLTGLASPVDAARVLDELPSKVLHEILGRCAGYVNATAAGFPSWAIEALREGARV